MERKMEHNEPKSQMIGKVVKKLESKYDQSRSAEQLSDGMTVQWDYAAVKQS